MCSSSKQNQIENIPYKSVGKCWHFVRRCTRLINCFQLRIFSWPRGASRSFLQRGIEYAHSRPWNLVLFMKQTVLVYTTQVNSTFRARWLASSEVISQVLFTSEQPKKNKMAFVGTLSLMKLLFWPLVIQLVWYILKKLFNSVSVKVVDIYLHFGE